MIACRCTLFWIVLLVAASSLAGITSAAASVPAPADGPVLTVVMLVPEGAYRFANDS